MDTDPNVAWRGGACQWPWPHARLSNGFEIEVGEVLAVRCLRDFEGDRERGTVKSRAGQRVVVRMSTPRGLELCKPGSGNRRWSVVKEDPVEGVDFETIPGEHMRFVDGEARDMVAPHLGAVAAEREAREVGPSTEVWRRTRP